MEKNKYKSFLQIFFILVFFGVIMSYLFFPKDWNNFLLASFIWLLFLVIMAGLTFLQLYVIPDKYKVRLPFPGRGTNTTNTTIYILIVVFIIVVIQLIAGLIIYNGS